MISFRANLDQLDEVRRRLRAQIVAANRGERILQHNLGERVQIGFPASDNRNFSFKK